MFNIARIPVFARTVTVQVPDGEGVREETLKATYRAIPLARFNAFDLTTPTGARDFLVEVVERLDELIDNRGDPVPYSSAVLDQVLDLPHARGALLRTYIETVGEAAMGNSARPPADG